jgi:hypothetical protein
MNLKNKTKAELIAMVEELTQDFENEQKRADEFFDELEQLRDGSHVDHRLISHEEFKDLEDSANLVNDFLDIQDDFKQVIERQKMGVVTFESVEELIDKLIEIEV